MTWGWSVKDTQQDTVMCETHARQLGSLTAISQTPWSMTAKARKTLTRKLWGARSSRMTPRAPASMVDPSRACVTASMARCFLCMVMRKPSMPNAKERKICQTRAQSEHQEAWGHPSKTEQSLHVGGTGSFLHVRASERRGKGLCSSHVQCRAEDSRTVQQSPQGLQTTQIESRKEGTCHRCVHDRQTDSKQQMPERIMLT